MAWKSILGKPISLNVLTKTLPTKGNMAYEYNPFRNYRLSHNMYEYKGNLYSLLELYNKFGIYLSEPKEPKKFIFKYKTSSGTTNYVVSDKAPKNSEKIESLKTEFESKDLNFPQLNIAIKEAKYGHWEGLEELSKETSPILHEKGELVDFVTDELNFSLNDIVTITPQASYDGSVNLILNDGKNTPRLINSRFSAIGKDQYEIIDRKGDNDTNIYDQGEQFDIDTSLYKRVTKIPKLEFRGVSPGGNLKIGNYHFYFKFADADGNETDFVAESGLVSLFIGYDLPQSVHTGISEENSVKSIEFNLKNIDSSYNYVKVYYSRNTSQPNQSSNVEYIKIDKSYVVSNNQECNILITGFENTKAISANEINLQYNIASAVKTAVECQNMLFMGNIKKPDIPYEELSDLALRFLPYVKETTYDLDIDENYRISSSSKGYYDPKYIYNKVGYWNEELYRFGIVFIMPNNELSPVFNIRGRVGVKEFKSNPDSETDKVNDGQYNSYNLYNKDGKRNFININEETFYVLDPSENEGKIGKFKSSFENAKGVVSFQPKHDTDKIYALEIRVDEGTINELKKYIKGYFFVRQDRIPTILCQGITLGIDQEAHIPSIPTQGGILSNMGNSLEGNTHVETDDINDINYITEGFLSRYSFKFEIKNLGFWDKFGKFMLIAAAVAAVVVASVVTVGVAGVAAGAGGTLVTSILGTSVGAVMSTAGTVAVVSGAVVGAAGIVGSVAGGIAEGVTAISRTLAIKKLEGRKTKVPNGYELKETEDSRKLTHKFEDRIIIKDQKFNKVQCIFSPDFEVNQPYFNQIFTGNTHIIRTTISQGINALKGFNKNFFTNKENHFYVPAYFDTINQTNYVCKVQGVPDDRWLVGLDDYKFRSRAGFAEEAWRIEQVAKKYKNFEKKINSDIVRGSFSPYIAMTGYLGNPCETVNIMIPGYSESELSKYVDIRMSDNSKYSAISDRYSISDIAEQSQDRQRNIYSYIDTSNGYSWEIYRGDCYICQVTHRVNRNFNDPSAPYNHEIVDPNTWKNNFDPDNVDNYHNINLGDVNAVRLGMWVTFKIRSSYNHCVRTVDESYTEEVLMCGHGRGNYPNIPMDTEGSYKTPESEVYNMGMKVSTSERYNFNLPNVPYIKKHFDTRIMYSDIHINDAYKNGYRVFKGTNFIDCPRKYGEITKLIEIKGAIVVVFEHGIGVCSVTIANVASNIQSGHLHMNVAPVISQPTMISDILGSQWQDSILKTDSYIYGVDTIAKKIWRTNGSTIETISDTKVQEFLNQNISLGEREKTPILGIRNVKTVYNEFKKDVMFTFYDNLQGFEEKVWNLCWNELLQKFITFYSWVPSYMDNIINLPFSFNRDTSKWIAKLGISHADNSFADGITLTNNILENHWDSKTKGTSALTFKTYKFDKDSESNKLITLSEKNLNLKQPNFDKGLIGILGLTNVNFPEGKGIIYKVDFSLQRDNFRNDKLFEIKEIGSYDQGGVSIPVYGLYLKTSVKELSSEFYYRNKLGHRYSDFEDNAIIPNLDDNSDNHLHKIIEKNYPIFKGRDGKRKVLNSKDMINPTHIVRLLNIKATISGIYGGQDLKVTEYFYNYAKHKQDKSSESHKEKIGNWINCGYYESVVAVIPRWNMQFLSTDFWKHGQGGLIDIADKIYPAYWYGEQHPFEFEFVVVNDATTHKIFTNLEIISNKVKPESFHFEVVGDVYDFAEDKLNMFYRQEAIKALYQYNGSDLLYNREFLNLQPRQQKLSADLPHTYFARQDTFNNIYDKYKQATSPNKDYDHIAGAEVTYYPTRQEFRIWNHQKAVSMDDFEGDSTSKTKVDNKFVYPDDGWEGARAIISSNCKFTEDRWRVTIQPIVVCYRNEFDMNRFNELGFSLKNSLWKNPNRPKLPILNSPLPIDEGGKKLSSEGLTDKDFPPELQNIGYKIEDLDDVNWLDDVSIHGYKNLGNACNREEVDVRGKFLKVRIRYTGDQLAIIDFINTIYQISTI